MPMAFMNAGLAFGVVATCTVGFICTYCVHILVSVVCVLNAAYCFGTDQVL
jgi:proton-coupled amino acid transporter